MLTLDRSEVASRLRSGDTRWIHRAAYDLMDYQPQATGSPTMPRGTSLYGSLPQQPSDPNSFASQLRDILALCGLLGLELVSLQQLPAAGGSVTRDGENSPP